MNTKAVLGPGLARLELALAVVAFAAFCVTVLTVAPLLIGPDGDAYRASILAITDGHFLTLTASQAHALAAEMARCPRSATACLTIRPVPGHGPVIEQWVRLRGRWISEKNPGYPFLAAPFQALGLIRLVPLFYGALGCLGLYAGARRWLGPPAGAIAVALFCSCDLAMLFAWQDYWATFTDAALIAAGAGALLWAGVASDAPARRRTWVGLLGFLALDAAVFIRYTNIVTLGCAIIAMLAVFRARRGSLPPATVIYWLSSVALFTAGAAVFNDLVYGGPLHTGYRTGEVTFSLSAILPNLRYMPARLIQAMPVLLLAIAGLTWITVRRSQLKQNDTNHGLDARRDFAIGVALTAPWLTLWGLYAAYSWTAHPGIGTWQSARFYLPAIGPITLLATWLLTRPSRLAHRPRQTSLAAAPATAIILILFALAVWTFRYQAHQAAPGTPPPHCNIAQPHCPQPPPPPR